MSLEDLERRIADIERNRISLVLKGMPRLAPIGAPILAHICTGTGLTPPTFAPGPGAPPAT